MNKQYLGKTKIETLLVMLLLILFSISTYTIVIASTSYYSKSQNKMNAKDNLRLSSSYIESRINQADKKDIKIIKNILGIDKAIAIEEEIDGGIFQTLIYFKDGFLRELFIEKGVVLEDVDGFEIAQINSIDISKLSKDLLKVTITTKANTKIYKSESIIKIL